MDRHLNDSPERSNKHVPAHQRYRVCAQTAGPSDEVSGNLGQTRRDITVRGSMYISHVTPPSRPATSRPRRTGTLTSSNGDRNMMRTQHRRQDSAASHKDSASLVPPRTVALT